jgi:hypothetical protein
MVVSRAIWTLAVLVTLMKGKFHVLANFMEEDDVGQCGELIWSQNFEEPTIEDHLLAQDGEAFPPVPLLETYVFVLFLHLCFLLDRLSSSELYSTAIAWLNCRRRRAHSTRCPSTAAALLRHLSVALKHTVQLHHISFSRSLATTDCSH